MDPAVVERVRFVGEGHIARGHRLEPTRRVGPPAAHARDHMRVHALPLTRGIAPKAYDALSRVSARLGIRQRALLFQDSGMGVPWNAHVGHWDDAVIVCLVGRALEVLDDAGLRHVIGHELGHHLAHSERDWVFPTNLDADAMLRTSMAREITADRVALIGEPSLETALAVSATNASGLSVARTGIDLDEYLAWATGVVEDALAEGRTFALGSHPEHAVRAYALGLFFESDVFAELTGVGSGARPLAAIDESLMRVLAASTSSESLPSRAPAAEPDPADLPLDLKPPPLGEVTRAVSSAVSIASSVARDAATRWLGRPPAPRGAALSQASPSANGADEMDPQERDLRRRFAELEARLAKKPPPDDDSGGRG